MNKNKLKGMISILKEELKSKYKAGEISAEEYVLLSMLRQAEKRAETEYNKSLIKRIKIKLKEVKE